ncbi:hypothetical protein [Pseudobacteriovorax antillogorgiicola]|nr:hypothetical protein [Pseudobacteriovorax antillogorgiicola]
MTVTQLPLSGFPGGHHGWVTSHNLALSGNSTVANYFVGYTIQFAQDYYYFLRSPFPSYIVMSLPQYFFESMIDQIFYTKILNAVIISLSIFFFQRVLICLEISRLKAIAITLLSFSGHYVTFYRDLVTPDVYSLLGIAIAIYGISLKITADRIFPLYVCAVLAPMLGWGYSVIPTFFVYWFLMLRVFHKNTTFYIALKSSLRHSSFISLFLACIVTASFLTHNILAEAFVRGVSLTEVGIVKSALFRLGIEEGASTTQWVYYLYEKMAKYFLKGFTPIWYFKVSSPTHIVKALSMSFICVLFISCIFIFRRSFGRLSERKRMIVVLLLLSGPLWLVPMRNLARFHDYTAIIFCPSYIAIYFGALLFLKKKFEKFLCGAAVVVYIASNVLYMNHKNVGVESLNLVTSEFEKVKDLLPEGVVVDYRPNYQEVIPGAPLAVGYYLKGLKVGTEFNSNYLISRSNEEEGTYRLLTPTHKMLFLYKRSDPDHIGKQVIEEVGKKVL